MSKAVLVQVAVDELGHGKLVLNGVDVSCQVSGFRINSEAGQVVSVTVTFAPVVLSTGQVPAPVIQVIDNGASESDEIAALWDGVDRA